MGQYYNNMLSDMRAAAIKDATEKQLNNSTMNKCTNT